MKRMAFQQTGDTQNAALENPVFLDGQAGIGGAGRIKPAGSEKKGRNAFLINIYKPDGYVSEAIGATL
jgi:hypothetical protein